MPRWSRLLGILLFVALGVGSAGSRVGAQAPAGGRISTLAAQRIQALLTEKQSRSAVQRKLDSQLVYALKMARGQAIAPGVQRLETQLPYQSDGRLVLDVRAAVSPALLAQLRTLGVDVLAAHAAYQHLRLVATLPQLEALAALPAVRFVQPQQEAVFHSGSVTSEGDVTHQAALARTTHSVDGTGVKIGVISNGVAGLAAAQASGDLGLVTVLPGQTGFGSEGTAMLEIVHDLAPGAQLYFATAANGLASLAQNIRDLRTAGCDIIVDDVFYFVESPFQDGQTAPSPTNGGVVTQAVKDVTADGALYFSSAGNAGNFNDGTSGTWEGDFVNGGAIPPALGSCPSCEVHDFGPQTFNVLNQVGLFVNLYWTDPLGGASNDYDLFRLDSTGTTVLASSTNVQSGTQDPYEQVSPGSIGDRIVIVKVAGAGRFLHLESNRGQLAIATAGQTHGHAATTAPNAFGVAATSALTAFPNPHSAANVVETYSSDGPRRIFFTSDGTAITPGNLSATGGQVLNKPDLTAADCVAVTGAAGFPTSFCGTSAAAPHAAAIAALIKSKNLSLTATQIRTALVSSAIDIEAPSLDRDSGVGIVMADAAVASVCPITLSLASAAYDAAGGGGSVDVTTNPGCTWTATSDNAGYFHVTGGASGTGSGTVTFALDANVGAANVANAARAGTLTIDTQTFTVNETGCTFGLSPTSTIFGPSANSGMVGVTTPSACSWTVTGLPAWASTTSGSGGTGPGTWQYTVQANGTGVTRAEMITVAALAPNFSLTQIGVAGPTPAYPLKTSTNGRYLVDQADVPFLVHGDSPQALIGNLSEADAEIFLTNRASYGFNTVWVNLLCNTYTACHADGTTTDGIAPFTVEGDLSTPNEAYFARADAIIQAAAAHGLLVMLDPIETGGWLNILADNGLATARAYGQYVGNRYKNFDNILWFSGNDFVDWTTPSLDALVQEVARGIQDVDARHLHTVQLANPDYQVAGSLDDPTWAPLIELDAAYTYHPTYGKVLDEYNRVPFLPVFMVEANYEFESNRQMDVGTPETLRRQEYWTALSGATGQLYGSLYSWKLLEEDDWRNHLDTPGAVQFQYLKALLAPRRWFDLIPDQGHTLVTAGYGTYAPAADFIITNDYATTARTADGQLAMAYLPTVRTLTVDMARLAGLTTARWYDPSSGGFVPIAGSPFANTGTRLFTPPGPNSDGDGDWVLVLEASSGCAYSVVPLNVTIDASGGSAIVTVTTSPGCSWTAVSNDPGYLHVTGGASGSDSGSVTYTLDANVGAPNVANAARAGTITIAAQIFTVNQTGCTFAIAPTDATLGPGAVGGAVDITTSSACSWTVSNLPAWVSTTSGGSSTGPGTWQYAVQANGTGMTRAQTVAVAALTPNFTLTQEPLAVKPLVPGTRSTFTLNDATEQRWMSVLTEAGRSYCAQLTPGATAIVQATPTLGVFRTDGTTPLGTPGPAGTCFIAPASETALIRVTQADAGARSYLLRVVETTLWANWWFVAGDYSSFTLLRNTTETAIHATLTWRSLAGVVVGTQTLVIPAQGLVASDARSIVSGATSGSVEIGHDGEPLALIGSQTTLSGATGLSFDTLLTQRDLW